MAAQDKPPLITSTSEDPTSGLFFYPLEGELLRTAGLGAIIGLLLPILSNAFDMWFIRLVFCYGNQTFAFCNYSGILSYDALTVLLAIGAIIILTHWQIFRPILIVIAVAVTMWGFKQHMSAVEMHGMWEYYTFSVLLYSAAYLLYYWLMRLKSRVASVVITLLVIVLIRWLLY